MEETKKEEPTVCVITIKKWKNTDKYPCPKCGKKIGMPTYICEDCNIKIKPVMNW
jgi:predicted RNA-binding Zn-ribbon protein involved in translation (DUF1610 family)